MTTVRASLNKWDLTTSEDVKAWQRSWIVSVPGTDDGDYQNYIGQQDRKPETSFSLV